jgi:hypothetical protein
MIQEKIRSSETQEDKPPLVNPSLDHILKPAPYSLARKADQRERPLADVVGQGHALIAFLIAQVDRATDGKETGKSRRDHALTQLMHAIYHRRMLLRVKTPRQPPISG